MAKVAKEQVLEVKQSIEELPEVRVLGYTAKIGPSDSVSVQLETTDGYCIISDGGGETFELTPAEARGVYACLGALLGKGK